MIFPPARHLTAIGGPSSSEAPPRAPGEKPGGRWTSGNRSQFERQATYMAAKGFVGATIEYRLVPDFRFPAPVEDSKAAVRWLRANATTYRIDTDRIGVAGGSAGGHLAAMGPAT